MNDECFNKCRVFLEGQIDKNPENKELVCAYVKLIEVKSTHDRETQKAVIEKDIRQAEFSKQFQTAVHTNDTQFNINANKNWAETQQNWHRQQAGMFGSLLTSPYVTG